MKEVIICMAIFFWVFFLTGGIEKGKAADAESVDPYPFLKTLFRPDELAEIQTYLKKDYHTTKAREEIQVRAREFFKTIAQMENQKIRDQGRKNKTARGGTRGKGQGKASQGPSGSPDNENNIGAQVHPFQELLEFLEKTSPLNF